MSTSEGMSRWLVRDQQAMSKLDPTTKCHSQIAEDYSLPCEQCEILYRPCFSTHRHPQLVAPLAAIVQQLIHHSDLQTNIAIFNHDEANRYKEGAYHCSGGRKVSAQLFQIDIYTDTTAVPSATIPNLQSFACLLSYARGCSITSSKQSSYLSARLESFRR
jgi:hypothetical protein